MVPQEGDRGSTTALQPGAQQPSPSLVVQQPHRQTSVPPHQTPPEPFRAGRDPFPPSPPATPPQSSRQQISKNRYLRRSHPFEVASQHGQQQPCKQVVG